MRLNIINPTLKTGHCYWIENDNIDSKSWETIKDVLRDPVDEFILFEEGQIEKSNLVEISFKPGVTDNSANSLKKVFQDLIPEIELKIATGKLLLTEKELSDQDLLALHNPLIERAFFHPSHKIQDYIPSPSFPEVKLEAKPIRYFNLEELTLEELQTLSKENIWAFSEDELLHIKSHFTSKETQKKRSEQGLGLEVSDIEMEILAQTWSEHCKHKIFGAHITYRETTKDLGNFEVNSVFKTHIRDITDQINKDWLISVFKDNAGIVRFGEKNDYCLKVETHNSPSALDPYGGALTGILGVNRDILGCGIGAEPIANTNVLCFGSQKYSKEVLDQLPTRLKKPDVIMKGVHRGIEDGGNKSGIPTVNGAMSFHDNYAGKPLVYCGTVGVLPQKIDGIDTSEKRHEPGDYIIICGGSVGADGIHGATFSSMELDDNSPATAVQIGDPFTQKRLTDFLLIARDRGLYRGITDNGAGGLSSSIGEMAEQTMGAEIHIEEVPLKYPGLSPFEIIISESQERMSFAVEPSKKEEFLKLAQKMQVNPAVIGTFHNKGSFDIYQEGKLLASLSLHFMHESLPQMKLEAVWEGVKTESTWFKNQKEESFDSIRSCLKSLLSNENIASKESWVRQYDHEVKAATLQKPFIQKKMTSPNNASVLKASVYGEEDQTGISVGCAILPHLSHIDTYFMTQMAIDETIRNLIVVGTDPEYIALCDNFCWPDPIPSKQNPDAKHKLAQLVRSTRALADTALAYKTPFISGKDSMKNDFIGQTPEGEKIKISVPPTLLITGIGKVQDTNKLRTPDFKSSGDQIFYIGPQDFSKRYKSHAFKDQIDLPEFNSEENWKVHNQIASLLSQEVFESIHDISEGGLLVALTECTFAKSLGADINNALIEGEDPYAFAFNELPAGYLVSIKKENAHKLNKIDKKNLRLLGEVSSESHIKFAGEELGVKELYQAWQIDWSQND
ncbi:MAG: phosphoribosylformylglycinamidine synthase [Halobacteriovoraceae bacterium]|nr:phosphoribosylformylglycinamidine synthase [Halobacteriovoraceae bacterium]